MKDPIVEEVRKHRTEHTRQFRGDLKAICADLRSVQTASGFKVVRLSPKRLRVSARSSRSGRRSLQPC
jgi:hypothetical protein